MSLSYRRKRCCSSLVSSGMMIITLLLAATVGSEVYADKRDEYDKEVMNNEQFRRHLEATSAETFANWTPEKKNRAIPLDLKLRSSELDGTAYLAGHGSYAQFFLEGGKGISTASNRADKGDKIVRSRNLDANIPFNYVNEVIEVADTSPSRAHKLELVSSKGLRGQQQHQKDDDRTLLQRKKQDTISLKSFEFTDTTTTFEHTDSQDYEMQPTSSGRELTRNRWKDRNNNMNEEMMARNKKNKESKKNKTMNEEKDATNIMNEGGRKEKKSPNISSFSPTQNTGIKDSQAFILIARPSPATNAPITAVMFQITDPKGKVSSWITVPQVGNDKYQIKIDGFSRHKGTRWSYEMLVQDASGKKSTTGAVAVNVDGGGGTDNSVEAPHPAPASSQTQAMRQQVVSDNDWPYGGSIRGSSGKILFEFKGQGEFVCSGTVVMDGNNGLSPNDSNGRSIIQTAAHCAYNDVLKEFATNAMFIPDQASTKSGSSNYNCNDDKMGCWKLSFAVVSQGWAEAEFPDNVGYDYAYYVVHDDPGTTHSGGYSRDLTGVLDVDVDPVKIDFDYNGQDFTFALGYSSDHDPNVRYCSMDQSTINGVSWYENLWLNKCGLGGGASGGPWVVDMDENGIGTLISINSWGFDDTIGMAGPTLNTGSGSFAECLFQKALTAPDPGKEGGYVVSC